MLRARQEKRERKQREYETPPVSRTGDDGFSNTRSEELSESDESDDFKTIRQDIVFSIISQGKSGISRALIQVEQEKDKTLSLLKRIDASGQSVYHHFAKTTMANCFTEFCEYVEDEWTREERESRVNARDINGLTPIQICVNNMGDIYETGAEDTRINVLYILLLLGARIEPVGVERVKELAVQHLHIGIRRFLEEYHPGGDEIDAGLWSIRSNSDMNYIYI
jgi:hypothetical protein